MMDGTIYRWKGHDVQTATDEHGTKFLARGTRTFIDSEPLCDVLLFQSVHDFLFSLNSLLHIPYSIRVMCVSACYFCGHDVSLPYPSRGHSAFFTHSSPISSKRCKYIVSSYSFYRPETNYIHQPIYIDLLTLLSRLPPSRHGRVLEQHGKFYFVGFPYVCRDCLLYRGGKLPDDDLAFEYNCLC